MKVMKSTITYPRYMKAEIEVSIKALEYDIEDRTERKRLVGQRVRVLNVKNLTQAEWYAPAIGETGQIHAYTKGHTRVRLASGKDIWLYPYNYELITGGSN